MGNYKKIAIPVTYKKPLYSVANGVTVDKLSDQEKQTCELL